MLVKKVDRDKFKKCIEDVLTILSDKNDAIHIKGEYFGYFVNRTSKRFLADPTYIQNSFNSAFFSESKKKTLDHCADSIAAMLNRTDPIGTANEFCYVLLAVTLGFLGESSLFVDPGYGFRAYLLGVLDRIKNSVETINTGSQRDATVAFRRHLVIRGVLTDVIELISRKYSEVEDDQQDENVIWENGSLV